MLEIRHIHSGGPVVQPGCCAVCGTALSGRATGRPQQFCTPGCRQRAYRRRKAGLAVPPLPAPREPYEVAGRAEKPVPHLSERDLLAWRGMLEAQARLLPVLDDELRAGAGLSVSDFDLLYQLWVRPGGRLRMKQLASALLITPSGATRVVARLEAAGLVQRRSRPGEQAVEAVLTGEGERMLGEAMDVHFTSVRRLFVDRLTGVELDQLVRIWRQLTGQTRPSA